MLWTTTTGLIFSGVFVIDLFNVYVYNYTYAYNNVMSY